MNRSIFKTISKSSRTTNRYQLRVNSTRQLSGWDSQNHPNSTNLNQDQRLSEAKARNGSIREKLKPDWLIQKEALKRNFPDGWNPPKKISRPSMTLLRTLHSQDPARFSLPVLSDRFKISPEAVRRILRSKWEPDPIKFEKLKDRWDEGSDGWIHYEKLETDQIPKNLASSLKSSDPRSSSSQNSDYLDHPGIYNSKESGGSFGRRPGQSLDEPLKFKAQRMSQIQRPGNHNKQNQSQKPTHRNFSPSKSPPSRVDRSQERLGSAFVEFDKRRPRR